ncbi:MAG: Flp pilus assembly protein CpaB [Bryobacterales bacterium]|nr:Flp pilus assembly protein CpaB [Bryobacterales bacterium]
MSAKQKNLVPLFGVAFIVAIVSTGIFYGLFVGKLNSATTTARTGLRVVLAGRAIPAGTALTKADVREVAWPAPPLPAGSIDTAAKAEGLITLADLEPNQLITSRQTASREGGGAGLGIPSGMRAISLNVHDSAGVVSMLKPGHRVDIQVVGSVPGPGQEAQLRTLLENIRVLAIPETTGMRGGSQVVTVLATPQQSAQLGLADTTAKVRLVLRNPADSRQDNPGSVAVSNLFRGGSLPPVREVAVRAGGGGSGATAAPALVALTVKVGVASSEALDRWAGRPREAGGLTIAVPSPQPVWASLEGSKTIEWLAVSNLGTLPARETGTQWTANRSIAGIRLVPVAVSPGRTRLRLQPETVTPAPTGVYRNRLEAELDLADGQAAVIRGFSDTPAIVELWGKLFPGRANVAEREVMLVIWTRSSVPAPAAVAQGVRSSE